METDMEEDSSLAMDVDTMIPTKAGGRKLTRGEKSRMAAKLRRDKENVAMSELIRHLPVSDELLNKMDKTSVIRLATCYLKIKQFVQKDMQLSVQKRKMLTNGQPVQQAVTTDTGQGSVENMFGMKEGQLMLEGLNGFLMFISKRGNIKFVSRSIRDHLGHKQEYLIGHSCHEIIHQSDQTELMKQFDDEGSKNDNSDKNYSQLEDNPQIVFYIRMKYNLPKPGSKTKHSGFMLVQWSGKMKRHLSTKTGTVVTDGLLCICRPMQTTSVVEIRMDGNMFMSRHDLGMKFTYCDSRIITLIGYEPNEVVGKTAYHFHNPIDAPKVSDCHQKLIVKGTSVSKYYRFLGKTDNWVWLQTRATIIYNPDNKPQYIVCMNYVISEEEGERYLMLEEHKHANTHCDNVCLTLPDNQEPHYSTSEHDTGPSIIELSEENLEKTACLNGQLDHNHLGNRYAKDDNRNYQTLTGRPQIEYDSAGNYVQAAAYHRNYQTDGCGTQQPGCSSFMLGNQSGLVNQSNTQPVSNSYSQGSELLLPTIPPPISEGHCQDMMVCSSPESSVSTMSPSPHDLYTPHDQPISNMYSTLPGSCHSNNSYSEDGGYESATSPYASSYNSSSMVSPSSFTAGNGPERGFTADTNPPTSFIQGQNCNFGVGYTSQGSMKNSHMFDSSNSQIPEAETILDELLKSFNNQNPSNNLEENMAIVYSTIENLQNANSSSVNSNVRSPSVSVPPPSPANSDKSSKDKSLLRSFLTMPEDDIPKSPFLFVANSENCPPTHKSENVLKSKTQHQDSPLSRKLSAAKKILSANAIDIDLVCKSSKSETQCLAQVQSTNDRTDDLDLSSMPDDISDFALQYLDSVMDTNAEAVITGLSSDTFMDATESELTQEFLSSLESQCQNPNSHRTPQNMGCVPTFTGDSRSCFTTQSQPLVQSFCTSASQSGLPSRNGQLLQSHDHVYHQSRQRINGQHSQRTDDKNNQSSQRLNGQMGARSQSCVDTVCSTAIRPSIVPTCRNSQTQTTAPRMSELERVLRCNIDDPVLRFNGNRSPNMCSSPRPFLQQLLTGELTKDRYMEMEERRCGRGRTITPP